MTVTQQGESRCSHYRWPDDPHGVYETLTDTEVGTLTADELRAAILSSATIMRDIATGQLCVFDASAMEPANWPPPARVPMIGPYSGA